MSSSAVAHCISIDGSTTLPLKAGDLVFKREPPLNSSTIHLNPHPLIVTGQGGFGNTVHLKEEHSKRVHKYVAGHVLVHGKQIRSKRKPSQVLQTVEHVNHIVNKAAKSRDPRVVSIVKRATPLLNEIQNVASVLPEQAMQDNRLTQLSSKLTEVTKQLTTGGRRKLSSKKRK